VGLNSLKSLNLTKLYPNNKNNKNNKNKNKNKVKSKPLELRSRVKSGGYLKTRFLKGWKKPFFFTVRKGNYYGSSIAGKWPILGTMGQTMREVAIFYPTLLLLLLFAFTSWQRQSIVRGHRAKSHLCKKYTKLVPTT
jgi:hypothetical protein